MDIHGYQDRELAYLMVTLRHLVEDYDAGQIHTVRLSFDENLKVKANGGMWTAPLPESFRDY